MKNQLQKVQNAITGFVLISYAKISKISRIQVVNDKKHN